MQLFGRGLNKMNKLTYYILLTVVCFFIGFILAAAVAILGVL